MRESVPLPATAPSNHKQLWVMRETVLKIFTVVFLVSLFCSLLVTSAATLLKPYQEVNRRLERIVYLLKAAGIEATREDALALFEAHVQPALVDLQEDRLVEASRLGIDPVTFSFERESRKPDLRVAISPEWARKIGFRYRPRVMPIFFVSLDPRRPPSEERFDRLVLYLVGKGLWSTLHGFLALENDLRTIYTITFFQHRETPGLGGEIDNRRWQALWRGKLAYDRRGEVAISVIKGRVDPTSPKAPYLVDGLTGATLTTRGVNHMVRYWLGRGGYGGYLQKLRERRGKALARRAGRLTSPSS